MQRRKEKAVRTKTVFSNARYFFLISIISRQGLHKIIKINLESDMWRYKRIYYTMIDGLN